jgi:hypothetical protein
VLPQVNADRRTTAYIDSPRCLKDQLMFIADLTDLSVTTDTKILAVGWLDRRRPLNTSPGEDQNFTKLTEALIEKAILEKRCILPTRGFHCCNICNSEAEKSNACVLVECRNTGLYFLTNFLLPHYICRHQYRPPAAFVSAVFHGEASLVDDPDVARNIKLTSVETARVESERMAEIVREFPHLRDILE